MGIQAKRDLLIGWAGVYERHIHWLSIVQILSGVVSSPELGFFLLADKMG